jgi:hypothetical protein
LPFIACCHHLPQVNRFDVLSGDDLGGGFGIQRDAQGSHQVVASPTRDDAQGDVGVRQNLDSMMDGAISARNQHGIHACCDGLVGQLADMFGIFAGLQFAMPTVPLQAGLGALGMPEGTPPFGFRVDNQHAPHPVVSLFGVPARRNARGRNLP